MAKILLHKRSDERWPNTRESAWNIKILFVPNIPSHLLLGSLLHLVLKCITFTVGITLSVNVCYIYGWYYI